MLKLYHHNLSSVSRAIRLILSEFNLKCHLIEEPEWARRADFLKLNPAGSIPVLETELGEPIVEWYAILEYLEETVGSLKKENKLFPAKPIERAEVRRLLTWFMQKFKDEVSYPIVRERVHKREMPVNIGGGTPDSTILRLARANIKPHMLYLDWLTSENNCLVGDSLTYADFAATGAVSVLDYLGEIEWQIFPSAKQWYTRMKSLPSTRQLLFDRVRGLAPAAHYTDLDF